MRKYSWPSTELHCGAIKLDWNDNVVASLGNWKSTQCEVANNTAQHGKTQGWQLLAYSLKQQLISRGKKGPPSHFKACTFHTLVGSLIPLGCITTQGPASLLSVVWSLLRRALPSPLRPTLQYEGEQIGGAFFSSTLKWLQGQCPINVIEVCLGKPSPKTN